MIGFVSRQEAEEYLHKSENETFLVRFSDSELGGVTVAWITGKEPVSELKLNWKKYGSR